MDRIMGQKFGINYCAPVGKIGFRGVNKGSGIARLIPLAPPEAQDQIFFFHGVDVKADLLPYLPDMGPGSDFQRHGGWHHYEISSGIFVIHLRPGQDSQFEGHHVLQAAHFVREAAPRVFLDRREALHAEGVLVEEDFQKIARIIHEKQLAL